MRKYRYMFGDAEFHSYIKLEAVLIIVWIAFVAVITLLLCEGVG